MEENEYANINKYIDQLPMFCNWELDTVSFAVGGITAGLMLDGYVAVGGFFIGTFLAVVNEKIKNGKYKNYIKHIFYMYGLISPKTDRLPPSYQRYFLS